MGVGCGLPRDPAHTFDLVQQFHHVRVGISEHPPWVIRTPGEPAGAEVELIRQFAREIGAVPDWIWGSENQHMQALKSFELDVVIAGLDKSTPWSKTVGLTRPYFEERIIVGVQRSMQQPSKLEGLTVAVKSGEATAAFLRRRHATPERVPDILSRAGPVAGPEWRLEQLGFTPTRFDLFKVSHVMAISPGENGWLMRLEQFLFERQSDIKRLLQEQAGTQ
jgi:ABC-type amino acid transport substrate-binding protein